MARLVEGAVIGIVRVMRVTSREQIDVPVVGVCGS